MVTRRLLFLLLLLWPAPVLAQLRPGAFTTLTTTSTSADSLHVGCAVGSSTCTGGIKSGPISGGTLVLSSTFTCTACVTDADMTVTGVTAATYGSATRFVQVAISAQGRITSAAEVTPQLTLSSTYFSSLNGSAITNLSAANITGTIPDGSLSANVPLLNAVTNTFTGAMIYSTTQVMSWNSKSTATNYTAASDGFVVAIVDCSGGGGCNGSVVMLSDTSATPTTMRGAANAPDGQIQSSMIPVRKSDKYRVNTTTGGGTPVFTVYWVPLGTGG